MSSLVAKIKRAEQIEEELIEEIKNLTTREQETLLQKVKEELEKGKK